MPGFYIFNDKYFQENEASISPDNRSYRYGDGLFETIRVSNGSIPLWDFHCERLFNGLVALKIDPPKFFTPALLHDKIIGLCKKNKLTNARIRLTVSRGEGGILEPTDPIPDYTIQSWLLDEACPRFNQNGLQLGIFPDGRKSIDPYASLKTNNCLLYVMAGIYAKEQKWNDAVVLNSADRIADTSIANIYWVKDGQIYTTPVSEGPVHGVMRRFLMGKISVIEQPLNPADITQASEMFITNAIRGIQWVGQFNDKRFQDSQISFKLYRTLIVPLFS